MIVTIGREQGNRRFSGAQPGQGLVIWPDCEIAIISLDPDGCLVRRFVAIETLTVESTDTSELTRRE